MSNSIGSERKITISSIKSHMETDKWSVDEFCDYFGVTQEKFKIVLLNLFQKNYIKRDNLLKEIEDNHKKHMRTKGKKKAKTVSMGYTDVDDVCDTKLQDDSLVVEGFQTTISMIDKQLADIISQMEELRRAIDESQKQLSTLSDEQRKIWERSHEIDNEKGVINGRIATNEDKILNLQGQLDKLETDKANIEAALKVRIYVFLDGIVAEDNNFQLDDIGFETVRSMFNMWDKKFETITPKSATQVAKAIAISRNNNSGRKIEFIFDDEVMQILFDTYNCTNYTEE